MIPDMKHSTPRLVLLFIAILSFSGSLPAADAPRTTPEKIEGGKISFDELRVLRTSREPMNFCFGIRFKDGTIWQSHSIGRHVVNERGAGIVSRDNGKTWEIPKKTKSGMLTCQLPDGSIIRISSPWKGPAMKSQPFSVLRWKSPQDPNPTVKKLKVEFPGITTVRMHRSLIRLADGTLLSCGYGNRKGEKSYWSFVIRSTDNGQTWQYLSELASDPKMVGSGWEGFCEPCLVQCENGRVLALLRTGGKKPMYQVASEDGGKTWSKPRRIAETGVSPHAIRLHDGTLVACAGRPGLYLLIDFSGTGDNWQRIDVYSGQGSSYASLMEIAPAEVLLVYDESSFSGQRGPGVLNRIMGQWMQVSK